MMTKEKISEYFIELLNNLEFNIDPKYPDRISYLYKDKLYMIYYQERNDMWLDNGKIWSVFETKLSLNYDEIQELTQYLLEEHLNFKLNGVTTHQFIQ